MPVGYKIDILAALKAAGYSSTRIRNENLWGKRHSSSSATENLFHG